MRNFFLCAILSLFVSQVMAQDATLFGVITDNKDGEALLSATVQIGSVGTVTDFEGKYELKHPAGTYTVVINYIGYETIEKQVTLLAGQRTSVDIQLGATATLLNTATVTSGKFEKPIGEVTVSLDIVQPDLIENANTVNIETALDKVPGVSIIDGQPNIRGGSGYSYGAGSRVLLLVDDIPILQGDSGTSHWGDIPVENIAQVEIVKGAASALYGSSALNGIINVRTGYATSEPETKISTFYTAFLKPEDKNLVWWDNTPYEYGITAMHKRKIGSKVDLVVNGQYRNRETYLKDGNDGGRMDFNGRIGAKLRYRITDRLNVGVNTSYNGGEGVNYFFWQGIDSLYVGDLGNRSFSKRKRYNIDPFVNYFDDAGNRHKFVGRFYNVENGADNNQANASNVLYGEYQFQRQFEDIDLVATAGLVGSRMKSESQLFGDTLYTGINTALYLQLDKKFFDRLNVSAGFRYEQNKLSNPAFFDAYTGQEVEARNEKESKPVFRLGLNYQAAEFTYLRASWGQGYRFPTVAEKFIQTTVGGIPLVANPDLTSETGWTTELGVKQGFRISDFEGFIDVSAFWSEYQDMMEFNLGFNAETFQLGFRANNVGNTRIRGIEASIMGRGAIGSLPISILAGYTYIEPEFQEFDLSGKDLAINQLTDATIGQLNAQNSSADYNILKYRFQHSAKIDMQADLEPISFGVAAIYNSHMDAIDELLHTDDRLIPDANDFRKKHGKGYVLLNLRAAYQITPKLKFSLLMKNALNQEYVTRVGILEAPRNISARIDWKF